MMLKNAEQFVRSDFITMKPGQESKIIKDKRTVSVEAFSCPVCGADAKVPEHGVDGGCEPCAVRWRSYGNALYLWSNKSR